jgi:4-hydroxy-tetrahydrodipicolinate synthase
MIQGILTPNLVPFRADGSIHEDELRRMIHWLIEKGVSGLYPNGSTGEFIRLTFEERKRLIRIVAEETRGRVPILAGAAEATIGEVLEAAALYADLGCTAISLTGPYYFKVSQESIEEYFREIARQSPIDILLYNIPQFANEISIPVVERLAADCPRIVGIKDSSRDFPRMVTTIARLKKQRPDFTVLTGTEETLMPALIMGADGGTIATSGVVPEVVMKLYHDTRAGRLDEARRIQFKLLDLIEAMFAGPIFPEGFRAAAALRGFDLGHSRQPISRREQADLGVLQSRIACILADCGFSEASQACSAGRHGDDLRPTVEAIVRDVISRLDIHSR